ncbi:hypothetical protein PAXINDRAFT_19857 [Paxillus involutus ATCC 200175]|uniref:Lectin n=1 Tax=Paxillus involutus ATCC 200175 TaxID=664439 RepID=A0A0C9SW20_PAXIN|nr:hypothetical protein PAXINDRAFT_19857 [Paxillus involutus ATCC 200175]
MSYSIKLQLYQINPSRGYFCPVENTCWNFANGATWSQSQGASLLTMGGSGTSGTLRLLSDKGERIIIAIGVDNQKRWCDVVTGLAPDQTGVVINGEYYNKGKRAYMREKQLAKYSVTSAAGTKVEVQFTVSDGKDLVANCIIG